MLHRHRKRFLYALRGIGLVLREEASFRFQTAVFIVVLIAGALAGLTRAEWISITVVSGAVLVLECLNSAVERLADAVEPRLHDRVRAIKDILAGAVLVMSLIAVAIGLIVFIPHLSSLIPSP